MNKQFIITNFAAFALMLFLPILIICQISKVYKQRHNIIENENGQVLLGKRTDNHQWGYAGGSIELGETVEEAACSKGACPTTFLRSII